MINDNKKSLTKIFKIVQENIKLRKQANTFENKYNAANEELLSLYRKKSNLIDERDQYKESALKFKDEIKKIKQSKIELENELSIVKQQLTVQKLKNEKLVKEISKNKKSKSKNLDKKEAS